MNKNIVESINDMITAIHPNVIQIPRIQKKLTQPDALYHPFSLDLSTNIRMILSGTEGLISGILGFGF